MALLALQSDLTLQSPPEGKRMSQITAEVLAELERMEKAASPGPWHAFGRAEDGKMPIVEFGHPDNPTGDYGGFLYGSTGYSPLPEENAALIAAMRNALPALIARIRELEALLTTSGSPS